MYQNCINAEVIGGDGSEMDELPTMFVASLANVNTCPTVEGQNVKFPFPGEYVTTKLPSGEASKTAATYPTVLPTGAGCAGNEAPVDGKAAVPTSSPAMGGSSSTASAHPSNFGGSSGLVTVTTLQTITGSSALTPAVAAPSTPSNSTSSSSSCAKGSTSCANIGGVVCIGATHFGLRDINHCAVPQLLAAGTHCTDGEVLKKREHFGRDVVRGSG